VGNVFYASALNARKWWAFRRQRTCRQVNCVAAAGWLGGSDRVMLKKRILILKTKDL
jgi:hypothetical protein